MAIPGCVLAITAASGVDLSPGETPLPLAPDPEFLPNILSRGNFGRCDLFLTHLAAEAYARQLGATANVRILRDASLAEELAGHPWDVHYGDAATGAYLRDTFAPRPFALAWHVSEGAPLPIANLIALLLSNLRPYDLFLFPSEGRRRYMKGSLQAEADRLAPKLGDRLGIPVRMETLVPGVDVERYHPGTREAARTELGLPWGRALFAFPAAPRDRLLPYLRAFAAAGGDALLWIWADEGEKDSWEKTLAQMGIAGARIETAPPGPLHYAAPDVLVTPDDPNHAVRAMASGVPVLASEWSAVSELVIHDVTGFLVPMRSSPLRGAELIFPDGEALFSSLARLRDDVPLRIAMGREARARAVERHAWPRVISRFQDLCEESIRMAQVDREFLPRPDRPGFAAVNLGYFDTFRQNYSRILDKQDALVTSALGRAALEGRHSPPVYAKLRRYLDSSLLARILERCREKRSIGELAEGSEPEKLRFHLLWMLKHGLLLFRGESE